MSRLFALAGFSALAAALLGALSAFMQRDRSPRGTGAVAFTGSPCPGSSPR